jgi:hypothetical protein
MRVALATSLACLTAFTLLSGCSAILGFDEGTLGTPEGRRGRGA